MHEYTLTDFSTNSKLLDDFAAIDESDISVSVKVWMNCSDKILSDLCKRLVNRRLFKVLIQDQPFENSFLSDIKEKIKKMLNLTDHEAEYYLLTGKLINNAYNSENDKINILYPNGMMCDIAEAADTLNIKVLSKPVEKYYLCTPDLNNN